MRNSKYSLSMLLLPFLSMGCSVAPNTAVAESDCNWVSVEEISTNPRQWTGERICTSGTLHHNDDFHSYLHLTASGGRELPAGVIIFLESFATNDTENSLLSEQDGAEIKISASLSIFEDCWDAEESGETEDPCLPARKPIFLDDIELISSD